MGFGNGSRNVVGTSGLGEVVLMLLLRRRFLVAGVATAPLADSLA